MWVCDCVWVCVGACVFVWVFGVCFCVWVCVRVCVFCVCVCVCVGGGLSARVWVRDEVRLKKPTLKLMLENFNYMY